MRYTVSMNGLNVQVHEARVSAYPFNQVWRGKQRPIEQTEMAWFVTIDISRTSKLEIEILDTEIERVEIRPLEYGVAWERTGNKLSVTVTKPMQFVVETNGKHGALHVFVNEPLQRREPSENEIYFGPGTHQAGVIMPKSDQTVTIDEGAVVYGSIFIHKAKNVTITGRGILDSSQLRRGNDVVQGEAGGELAETLLGLGFSKRDVDYSGAFVAYECENLKVDGIVIRDSMLWTMILRNNCRNVVIENIKIIGQWRYNSDGINICASEHVVVKNSFVRSFDDCIVIRNAYLDGETSDTQDITVENCVLWCDWGKSIEVWAGNVPSSILACQFRNNFLIHLSSVAMDVTTWFGSRNTFISDIVFKDIYINTDKAYEPLQIQNDENDTYRSEAGFTPLLFNLNCDRLGENLGNQKIGVAKDISAFQIKYQNIFLENIRCHGPGIFLDVSLDSIRNPVEINQVVLREVDAHRIFIAGKIRNLSIEPSP